jgi:hypothetical protein
VGHILILGGCNVQKIKVHGTGIDYQSYMDRGKDVGEIVTDFLIFRPFTNLKFLEQGEGQMQPPAFMHQAIMAIFAQSPKR